jgi:hypothetical protein
LGDGVIAMKLGLLAFEALAIAALIGILRRLKLPVATVVAYAWHPLPVWEIAGNGHVDAVLLGLSVASLWLFVERRERLGGLLASLAVFVKPTALLLMPVYWRPWDWRLPATLLATGFAVYAPYLGAGPKVLGFLQGYVVEEELSSGGGFRYLGLLQRLTGPIPASMMLYLLAAGVVLAWIALRIGFREDRTTLSAIAAYGLLLTVFLLILTPHYPWYYLALGPYLALSRCLTPWVLMTGGFLLHYAFANDPMPAFEIREGTLHLAALAAFIYDVWTARLKSLAAPLEGARP